jgi:lipopolysaccharide biosynthesis glycosyltransferase
MNIVYCVDKKAIPGLHVSAFSLLDRITQPVPERTTIHIISDEIDDEDMISLNGTLSPLNKHYSLELHRVDSTLFSGFPKLNGGVATYYRLAAPHILDMDRFLYIDVDTLCDIDVGVLNSVEMGSAPAALVPEAPLSGAVDRHVAHVLGNSLDTFYYNAGVILVNVEEWRREMITERAMEYLKKNPAHFWDQSALNVVLRGKVLPLEERYNTIANMRKNWPLLTGSYGTNKRLIHFVDYPKPWGFLCEFLHPQSGLWQSVFRKTELKDSRSWNDSPSRVIPTTCKQYNQYIKSIKDSLLFSFYQHGFHYPVKGIA